MSLETVHAIEKHPMCPFTKDSLIQRLLPVKVINKYNNFIKGWEHIVSGGMFFIQKVISREVLNYVQFSWVDLKIIRDDNRGNDRFASHVTYSKENIVP